MAQADSISQNMKVSEPKSGRLNMAKPKLDRSLGAGRTSRMKPQDLISLLTQHYERVRARSRPKVTTRLACFNADGKLAVRIRFG